MAGRPVFPSCLTRDDQGGMLGQYEERQPEEDAEIVDKTTRSAMIVRFKCAPYD
jgi:hypothetical protein